MQTKRNIKIDLLIICGDFQSIRNEGDLDVIACPPKFRSQGIFYQYYKGEKKAPIPTVFIGGNHEASNYLWELYYGGWICPNIYYLGFAGAINFGPLRIVGLSGIFKPQHYELGFHETQPFNDQDSRSIYHIRKYIIQQLALIQDPIDVFISHDWPKGIARFGNTRKLTQTKTFLAKEIYSDTLGSPPSEYLLKKLQPSYWFASHLHVKFPALYPHHETEPTAKPAKNPEEIEINDADSDNVPDTPEPIDDTEDETTLPVKKYTRFLALDKCLPQRDFLQVISLPDKEGPYEFEYDEEWMAILRATAQYMTLGRMQQQLPDDETLKKTVEIEKQWVKEHVSSKPNGLKIPLEFQITAPAYAPGINNKTDLIRPHVNPQTVKFCELLSIPNKINPDGVVTNNPVVKFEAVTIPFSNEVREPAPASSSSTAVVSSSTKSDGESDGEIADEDQNATTEVEKEEEGEEELES
ncbi:lariat debranching enzyme [Nowakowskiella sp. JEL0407]|nr:lariat debranching enzyme [Nowakowskiella sp. JEL0407]